MPTVDRNACAICGSLVAPSNWWRIPFCSVPDYQLSGFTCNQAPMADISLHTSDWMPCQNCQSVSKVSVPTGGHAGHHEIEKMKSDRKWAGYHRRYDRWIQLVPEDASVMVDAACGIGQYMRLAKQRADRPWRRMIGLEYNQLYVEHMRQDDFMAYQIDMFNQSATLFVDAGTVDWVVFSEAFEHMVWPIRVLQDLMSLLRPGGVISFSAQAASDKLPIRPAETVYVTRQAVLGQLDGSYRVLECELAAGRYLMTLQKK